ncbi:2-dehydropantoate 2-reductase [Diplodia corticola]|uniref:2-dehydropantoate 2-reductase n=1 Tax=Diplodia corticola TaxID=236234 RepID=A0A1J9S6U9_9PEZI|nr:2-dehydropantoate 2-reductase [Diplodia corticola]OJD40675.1 2-dehydropantoate 2-reductase [Diplodia corticola]
MDDHIDVLLYGLGAIGSFYAFILSRAPKVRLTVVARSNYAAVKEKGLTIDSQNHGKHVVHPFEVVKSPSELQRKFDYIVCANKATDPDETAKALVPVVDQKKTTIVIAQNGVGNEPPFRALFPLCTIITCAVWVGAIQPEPGFVKHMNSENTQLGLFKDKPEPQDAEDQARLDLFAELFRQGGTIFELVEDMQVQRWEKVVWNAAWNTLTTLTMLDTKSWLNSSPRATPMTRDLMKEMIDVARACNVNLDYSLIDRLMDKILAMPGIGSSMQTDCKNGKPMEVEVILGYPVRKARELGVKTPIIDTLHTLLLAVDLKLRNESK